MDTATRQSATQAIARPTRVRHVVLWLTVAVYALTYMDRVVISNAVPFMEKELGFSLVTTGWILGSFRWGYALFQIPGGWFGDKVGPRRALAIIVTWWSVFTSATALAWSPVSMAVTRFFFGVGEAGAFPIATRSLSRWMLPSERGYAQGITHAGSRLGAAITPPIVVWLIMLYGWRAPFYIFGAIGILWAIVWYVYYRDTPDEHRSVNSAERDLLHSALGQRRLRTGAAVPWRTILSSRTLWVLSLMYFCYGSALAFYVDWFPKYLNAYRGFDLKQMGIYASLPLFAGTLGDLLGGWSSDLLFKRTGDIKMSRRWVGCPGFLIAAVGLAAATQAEDPYTCVLFSCLAMFGLEITVGVSWAIPLDIGGDFAGSVSSVMNTCGNIGSAILTSSLAYFISSYGWNPPLLVLSMFCLIGAALFVKIDASRRIFPELT